MLSDHIKQEIVFAFQTRDCLTVTGSSYGANGVTYHDFGMLMVPMVEPIKHTLFGCTVESICSNIHLPEHEIS